MNYVQSPPPPPRNGSCNWAKYVRAGSRKPVTRCCCDHTFKLKTTQLYCFARVLLRHRTLRAAPCAIAMFSNSRNALRKPYTGCKRMHLKAPQTTPSTCPYQALRHKFVTASVHMVS